MKLKKYWVLNLIDKLFWLFIMVFPIFGYLLYIPSVKAEKTITNVVDDVNYELHYINDSLLEDSIDLSSSYVVFWDIIPFDYMSSGVIFTSSAGYYVSCSSMGVSLFNSMGKNLVFFVNSVGERFFSSYMLPDDFGYITSYDFQGINHLLFGFMLPIKEVTPSVAVDDGILTFSQYWNEKLYLMPDTNNVVGESLQKLFEKGFSFFEFFENASVFVSILLWIIAVEFAHFFVDIVLFLPRFIHNLCDKFCQGG